MVCIAAGNQALDKTHKVKQNSFLIGFFTIKKPDTFLSDYLADLKLHSTKQILSKIVPSGIWTHNFLITSLMLYWLC